MYIYTNNQKYLVSQRNFISHLKSVIFNKNVFIYNTKFEFFYLSIYLSIYLC